MPRTIKKAPSSLGSKRGSKSSQDKNENFEAAPYDIASQIRGLYRRVAVQLGVDPSYVSRVARSERRSQAVAEALERDLEKIMKNISERSGSASGKAARKKRSKRARK